jgi:diguanylate cyclase (GGDEF)-like protein/PAS domain S-box-containing protein
MDLRRPSAAASRSVAALPARGEACAAQSAAGEASAVMHAADAARRDLYESLPDGVLVVGEDGVIVFANGSAASLLAAADASRLIGRTVDALLPPSRGAACRSLRGAFAGFGGRPEAIEVECMRLDGVGCVLEASVSLTEFDGRPVHQALLRDATGRRLRQTLAARTRDVLLTMADGAPLAAVLRQICMSIERVLSGSARCGITLLDPERRRLQSTVSGTLPQAYCDAIHGLDAGHAGGPCGAAVALDRRVIVEDIDLDPLCAAWREHAAPHGLRACWATPLHDAEGRTAGSLAVFHDTPQRPGEAELDVVDAFVRLAEEALRRTALRERMKRDRMRHESVLQAVGAAVLVFRRDSRVSGWNAGAKRLLGLNDAELAGMDVQRLLHGAVTEDGEPLRCEDSPIERCVSTRAPQRDRVIGLSGAGGRRRWVSVNVQPVAAAHDEPDDDSVVCSFADITDIKTAQHRLEQLARTDVLTGLPNRLHLQAETARRLAAAARDGRGLGMLMLDLDGFKHVNDTLGHAAGDALLIDVSQRIEGAIDGGDLLARLGGDEFVVLSRASTDTEALGTLARRIATALVAPVTVGGIEVFVSAAVGGALYPLNASTPEALMRCADAAMYRSKRIGRGQVAMFGPELAAPRISPINRITVESDLRHALERGEFELLYQPRWRAVDGSMAGVEALLRWRHRERGLLSPREFVPLAEETGLIVPIGRWVLDEACRQTAAWRAAGVAVSSVAVNVSAAQFSPELFESTVPEALRRHDVAASDIELEITETVMMRQLEDAEAGAIQTLRARGLRLLLDDFGTGFSSLSHLQRFPLDGLKIDRSFIARLPYARDSRAIVEAIVGLSRELSIVSIAEGVETEEQAAWLRRAGCNELQGFLYAQPMPAAQIEALLAAGGPRIAAGASPLPV